MHSSAPYRWHTPLTPEFSGRLPHSNRRSENPFLGYRPVVHSTLLPLPNPCPQQSD
ncbi:Uncharacterised protein [Vibrio cholerae]|nr:Uncharacterised protein [Vibrio cholerae]